MTILRRQSLVAYAAPLSETVAECPVPSGSEVLVRVHRCGVCHSDLHMQDGYFDLGNGKKLDVTGGRSLPFTLGHEIAGVVEQIGPDAQWNRGSAAAVFPWIGCGACAACLAGEENLCAVPRHLGIYADGGFATHVLVPHPRYLLEYEPLSPAFAAALMCSGLTAYAALRRLTHQAQRGPVLLIGMGGVGMMGLAIARALFADPLFVADIDPSKREAALQAGAKAAFDPTDPSARKALMAATSGITAACDFVGSAESFNFAQGALARGGKLVITGLFGGTLSMPLAMLPIKAQTIEGVLAGTLDEAHELFALARAGKIAPLPISERPLEQAQAALDDLRRGRVVGRVVLTA